MVPVYSIFEEAQSIVGNSRQDFVFKRITDAVELLANKGEFDPLVGYMDVCVDSCLVTLPREVETVTAVNMAGLPAVARDQVFMFHLNGPGQRSPTLPWQWFDMGLACVYREIRQPVQVLGWCRDEADEDSELWVYGFDDRGNALRTEINGTWQDGYLVPVKRSFGALPAGAPLIARITRVRKAQTVGPVRLSTVDNGDYTGTLLGIYQWDELEPRLRRIKLSTSVPWVTISFRRRTLAVGSKYDLLPVNNPQAVLMMIRALRHYQNEEYAEGEAAEATATRWATEEQHTSSAPVIHPLQVHDASPLNDPCDYID